MRTISGSNTACSLLCSQTFNFLSTCSFQGNNRIMTPARGNLEVEPVRGWENQSSLQTLSLHRFFTHPKAQLPRYSPQHLSILVLTTGLSTRYSYFHCWKKKSLVEKSFWLFLRSGSFHMLFLDTHSLLFSMDCYSIALNPAFPEHMGLDQIPSPQNILSLHSVCFFLSIIIDCNNKLIYLFTESLRDGILMRARPLAFDLPTYIFWHTVCS